MTETEWNACADPQVMLAFLNDVGKGTERKMRLFACACARRIWDLLKDERSRLAVEIAEQYVDGEANNQELGRANAGAVAARLDAPSRFTGAVVEATADWRPPTSPWSLTARAVVRGITGIQGLRGGELERAAQANLLRDICGPLPFRPISIQHSLRAWKDGCIGIAAKRIYDKREFDHLPFLADRLQEAGCHDEELLAHLRSKGPHARGCWAVDVILRMT
jgi:hypothetical protein